MDKNNCCTFADMKSKVEQIQQLLLTPKKVVIVGHLNPDGDTVGSALALAFFLRKKGHQCNVLIFDNLDYTLTWMPEADKITIYKKNPEQAKAYIAEAEVFFCVDYNGLERTGDMAPFIRDNTKAPRILIDHHLNPSTDDFDIIISTPNTSSTAELTYDILKLFNEPELFDKDIATALYAGIITDTGALSYSCENTSVYYAVAELTDMGINVPQIRNNLYNMLPESRLRVTGYGLYVKMKIIKAFRTAYIVLTQDELHALHYQKGDSEGLVNYCISMKNIVFGCIIIEQTDRIQLSFRSRGNFDVSKIAVQHFEGGGHKNASGASSYVSLEKTVARFESILPLYRQELLEVVI
jgi:phosphoesterase RecJ-like protein